MWRRLWGILKKNICTIKNGKLVLSGTCTDNSQLWISDDIKSSNTLYNEAATVKTFSQVAEPQTTINLLSSHTPSHAANALCPEPHLAARIAFSHATLFSPEISTFCSDIDAVLLHSLPGNITSSQVRKHIIFSEAMHKGHLDQERQGIRSTKLQEPRPTLQQTTKNQELIELSKDDTDLLQSCNYLSPIKQRTTNFYFACH